MPDFAPPPPPNALTRSEYDRFVAEHGHTPTWMPHENRRRAGKELWSESAEQK